MNNGMNTAIVNVRANIINEVNTALQIGVPVAAIDGVLESVKLSVQNILRDMLNEEDKLSKEASEKSETESLENDEEKK